MAGDRLTLEESIGLQCETIGVDRDMLPMVFKLGSLYVRPTVGYYPDSGSGYNVVRSLLASENLFGYEAPPEMPVTELANTIHADAIELGLQKRRPKLFHQETFDYLISVGAGRDPILTLGELGLAQRDLHTSLMQIVNTRLAAPREGVITRSPTYTPPLETEDHPPTNAPPAHVARERPKSLVETTAEEPPQPNDSATESIEPEPQTPRPDTEDVIVTTQPAVETDEESVTPTPPPAKPSQEPTARAKASQEVHEIEGFSEVVWQLAYGISIDEAVQGSDITPEAIRELREYVPQHSRTSPHLHGLISDLWLKCGDELYELTDGAFDAAATMVDRRLDEEDDVLKHVMNGATYMDTFRRWLNCSEQSVHRQLNELYEHFGIEGPDKLLQLFIRTCAHQHVLHERQDFTLVRAL